MLNKQEVRAFYDWFGARQDWQRFYEGQAIRELLAYGQFEQAEAVFEFGCGTGALAERLLADHLPGGATYLGWDISATMVGLAQARLARFGRRARVSQTDGSVRLDLAGANFDRFISTYVVDLLPEAEIRLLLAEAGRVLRPGGRLGLVSLTHGTGPFSCLLVSLWQWLYARQPGWLGGCRPVRLIDFIAAGEWRVRHHQVITAWGIPSEVVVAEAPPGT